jgi:DNA repair protein RadC
MGTLSIGKLLSAEKPRDKLTRLGVTGLSDAELLDVMLGASGRATRKSPAARAAVELLRRSGARVGLEQLRSVKGLGPAKACSILASLELARRVLAPKGPKLECARDVYVVADGLRAKRQEQLVMMTADADGNMVRRRTVFAGTMDPSLVQPRDVFTAALTDRAASVFLAHNHPPGNERPSVADVAATRRIVQAGRALGIEVRDHVIVTTKGYFSFRDHGLI